MAVLVGFQVGMSSPHVEWNPPGPALIANLAPEEPDNEVIATPTRLRPATRTHPPTDTAVPRTATPALPTSTPAPTAPPPTPERASRPSSFSPTQFTPDLVLASKVTERLAGRSGRIGVAIKDLRTGHGVLIDPDGEYEAASLFKLSVMYEVFKQRDEGRLSFDEQLVYTERHVAFDLGTLDRPAGSIIRLDDALERMITISDNSSAILLTDRVGAININHDLQGLGLSHTRVLLDDLRTSPADMLAFNEMLELGRGVSPESSAEMVRLLARQKVNDRIPRLLPSGTVVAHKTGNLPGVVNDVGIVYGPNATFVIAVLVDGTRDEGTAATTTAQIARDAYDYFSSTAESDVAQVPTASPTVTHPPTQRPADTPAPSNPTNVPATVTPTLITPSLVPSAATSERSISSRNQEVPPSTMSPTPPSRPTSLPGIR